MSFLPQGGLSIIPVTEIGEIQPGDDLARVILDACQELKTGTSIIEDLDVIVVTQKIVSKAENRLVEVDPDDPHSHVPVVRQEAVRVLRTRDTLLITETRHGFVCANSGVDRSNVDPRYCALLPLDPDRSANTIRIRLERELGITLGVIISDTFGRAWRKGLTDVAIGCSGIGAIVDLKGQLDAMGRELQVTEICVVDELAGAAELVMGKSSSIPVVIIRGLPKSWFRESKVVDEVVRPAHEDLFR